MANTIGEERENRRRHLNNPFCGCRGWGENDVVCHQKLKENYLQKHVNRVLYCERLNL